MNRLQFAILLPLVLLSCGKGPEEEGEIVIPLWPPENVRLHKATNTSLTFQWDPVVGATSYGWQLMDMDYAPLQSGSVTQRNVEVIGLMPGTTYRFSVRCQAKDEVFEYSSPIEAKTQGDAPLPGQTGQCVDAPLVVEVGSGAVLGTSGLVQVFKADGTLVDKIDLADLAKVKLLEDGTMVPAEKITGSTTHHSFLDKLHSGSSTRLVHYTPLRLQGDKLYIKLHDGVLDFGGSYYLTMDASVAGKAVGKDEFSFAVKGAPAAPVLKVKADGSGDFCTVQGALSYAGKLGKDTALTIEIGEGTYHELLYLRDKNNLTVKGVSPQYTVIAYPNSELYAEGTSARCLWLVENCHQLTLENLTLENTFYASDHKGQAETIYFNSGNNSHRLTIENCSLISWQDTFLCKGEVYVHGSLISGHCDFIWGYPKACLFEQCEIRSRAAGYIVQARVPAASDKGFVFLNCHLTAESGVKDGSMYLARSAGQSDCYDNVTYVDCTMTSAIAPAGWYNSPAPNPAAPGASAGWKEYGTTGVSTSQRNTYGYLLKDAEVAAYSSREAVLGW